MWNFCVLFKQISFFFFFFFFTLPICTVKCLKKRSPPMAVAVSYISSFQSQDFFTQFKYQHIYEFNAKSICFGNSVKHVDINLFLYA